ncbi:MAG: hypothetical protein JWP09_824 [Candidatus Taylorbacteria bacterium]|nr:hypothetical protein [Candidatus Taylorbacteria bacterium]
MILNNLKKITSTILVIASFIFGANIIYSWTAPSGTPPTADAPTPINIGPNTQLKTGAFGIDGNFLVVGNTAFTGKIKIADGSQGAGKYLTSDKDGNATWKQLP